MSLILGIFFIVLGIIGVILPIMPGLIFFVVAGYFLQKSSPKMHKKLLRLPYIGQAMSDWENYAVMSWQTKLSLISFCFTTTIVIGNYYKENLSIGIILFNFSLVALFSIWAIDRKVT